MISLLIAVIGIVSLYAISSRYEQTVVTSITNDLISLPSRMISAPGNALRNFTSSVDHLINTYEENEKLKSKVETTFELEVRLAEMEKDNQKMKDQLELVDTLNEYQLINAAVISRNPDNWLSQIIINKGSTDGIEINMSIMAGNGLIGRVTEVNLTTAKVSLMTSSEDSKTRIAGMIQVDDQSIYGTVARDIDHVNSLLMTQIDPDAEIKIGDKVITSGLGGVSPRGLLIGTVEEIKNDRYGLFKEVRIKPAADTNDMRYVSAVKRMSESGE